MGGVLAGLTVVDIAERAPIGGHMLAQLGARVFVGSAMTTPLARAAGSSFAWRAYAAGKVGMDEGVRDGLQPHQLLARLKTADILFESEQPGELSAIGLGYEALHEIYPWLIHVSITPFGSTGPKALWKESDLILWAAGGPLFPSRDGGRPPLRISVPQSWLHAGADAACGALIAYHARRRSGLGQHVDISVQQSVTQATVAATIASAVGHEGFSFGVPLAKKSLDLSGSGARTRRSKWALRDGLVEMHLGLGPASGAKTNNFFAWDARGGSTSSTNVGLGLGEPACRDRQR